MTKWRELLELALLAVAAMAVHLIYNALLLLLIVLLLLLQQQ